MTDNDKKAADDKKTADDKKATDEPTEEPEAEEPKAEKPDSDAATPAGTDQQGRQLYNVKCSDCGNQTQVPFKPSGDRPVYCRDCYTQKRNDRG